MTPKLTPEQRAALRDSSGPVPVEDDETHEMFYLVDRRVVDALKRQQDAAAVREGLADAAAGRVIALDELDARIRAKYGEWPRE